MYYYLKSSCSSIPASDACSSLTWNVLNNSKGWDAILIYMSVNKLDHQTRKDWEQSLKVSTEVPLVAMLLEF